MKTILAFFGYVKIPTELVKISIILEDAWEVLSEKFDGAKPHYNAQKTVTKFLRSGRPLQ